MDYDETIDVAIALDMSGSIFDTMARDFLSEVKGIMDQYTNFRVHLFCFDTSVHNPQVYTENNMAEFMEYELAGGGGTDFDCCFNYMKDAGIQPKKFIMFTDGYPWNSWGDENYCDTLFIVHGARNGRDVPTAPFGITVPYEGNQ
jgi:predicted metal-dependent peptidase